MNRLTKYLVLNENNTQLAPKMNANEFPFNFSVALQTINRSKHSIKNFNTMKPAELNSFFD